MKRWMKKWWNNQFVYAPSTVRRIWERMEWIQNNKSSIHHLHIISNKHQRRFWSWSTSTSSIVSDDQLCIIRIVDSCICSDHQESRSLFSFHPLSHYSLLLTIGVLEEKICSEQICSEQIWICFDMIDELNDWWSMIWLMNWTLYMLRAQYDGREYAGDDESYW